MPPARDIVRSKDSVYTTEGNLAGRRAAQLEKQRQREEDQFEISKQQIQEKHKLVQQKFAAGHTSAQEESFKSHTIGLVTIDEFKAAAARANEAPKATTEFTDEERIAAEKKAKKELKRKRKEKKKMMSTLSFAHDEDFAGDDEQDDDAALQPHKVSKKDPTVDTSFLPDAQRQQQQQEERQRLESEWHGQQESIKREPLEITYSYWDGSGHRRTALVTKGDTIAHFLDVVRRDLMGEFKELVSASADDLLYVKEDLILPHDWTFYDLIVTKARGKSGPLFQFDVTQYNITLGPTDVRVESAESHPGKVVNRTWYERHKHVFPASRWEVYDPSKDYGKYTIKDTKKR